MDVKQVTKFTESFLFMMHQIQAVKYNGEHRTLLARTWMRRALRFRLCRRLSLSNFNLGHEPEGSGRRVSLLGK